MAWDTLEIPLRLSLVNCCRRCNANARAFQRAEDLANTRHPRLRFYLYRSVTPSLVRCVDEVKEKNNASPTACSQMRVEDDRDSRAHHQRRVRLAAVLSRN